MIGVAAGLLRVIYVHKENVAELGPVDMCCNSLITAAYDVAVNSYEEPPIYNYVTSKKNPLTWQMYCDLCVEKGVQAPLMKMAWYYTLKMSSSKFFVSILIFLYHWIPAAIVDFILLICGKKPK